MPDKDSSPDRKHLLDQHEDDNLVADKASAKRSAPPGAPDVDESTRTQAEAMRDKRSDAVRRQTDGDRRKTGSNQERVAAETRERDKNER